ncbi:hypothetical protein HHL23_07550 [Chryseobacterium sp. RP-3-3]|uniref:Uncharacterized protein n=1 Tax=Chryseobacterium antibioticum TaxID=2728847 RepID=A0A7Y0ALM9_9FLAO|nr:hypothetical protein [Chryseobacterium antibioticum]NML69648.1 hypothetical protein [Chryseobacterium antibioticum]
MYTVKFLEYNQLLKRILSEEDTLENICDLVVEKKPNKEEKEALKSTEDWAKYAFEKNKEYHLVFYNGEKSIAHITNSFFDITVDFLDYIEGELKIYLSMTYFKFNMDIVFKQNRNEKFPNDELFLGQINNYFEDSDKEIQNELAFKLNGNTNIFITTLDKESNKSNTEVKKTKVNISHNFIRSPETYKDYEYLLDYKSILKPEYLDIVQ